MPDHAYKYQPEFCELVVKLGAEGKSITQMAAQIGVCVKTLKNWSDRNSTFKAAMDIAITLGEAYWEEVGQRGTKGILQKFNPVSWAFMMKSRYRENWKEDNHTKIELNTFKHMSDDEIDALIVSLEEKRRQKQESVTVN